MCVSVCISKFGCAKSYFSPLRLTHTADLKPVDQPTCVQRYLSFMLTVATGEPLGKCVQKSFSLHISLCNRM